MPILFIRLFRVIEKSGWKISIFILAALFVAGWLLMAAFEPPGSEIVTPGVYWWWFLVTTTTVGYGDYSPVSAGGRLIATVIMVSGIGAIGIVITQMASVGTQLRRRMMEGTIRFKKRDHIVILGYHPRKTESIVDEILADKHRRKRSIVLCFKPEQAQENPIPDAVLAVKGDLTSRELLQNSCVDHAARIVADGQDDNETLIMCLAVTEVNTEAHIVAAVENMESTREHLMRIRKGIECVPRDLVTMIVQAVQDPGITRLYSKLLSNVEGHAGYRLDLSEDAGEWEFGPLLSHFKKNHNAIIVAATESHGFESDIIENPPWDFRVKGGMSLFYIAPARLTEVSLPS
jgi:voltage-gated potassium channel